MRRAHAGTLQDLRMVLGETSKIQQLRSAFAPTNPERFGGQLSHEFPVAKAALK
jgi:hypothetical protein